MLTVAKVSCIALLFLIGSSACGRTDAYAQGTAWHIAESWGDFWINEKIALRSDNPTFGLGDNIRTGQDAGVRLARGKDSLLLSPNAEFAISKNSDNELSTKIIQRTGAITIEVEPNDMKHFEIETPYLGAVAKGASFLVVIEDNHARVRALRGEVEVSDFRTGQRAFIVTGQTVESSIHAGLLLSGDGEFADVLQGTPHQSQVTPSTLSSNPPSTAVQAPDAKQTSPSKQIQGIDRAFGTGQASSQDTKAAIEKFFSAREKNIDAQETKDAVKNFFSSSGQEVDARATREAIKNFFAVAELSADAGVTKAGTDKSVVISKNSHSAQDTQLSDSTAQPGHDDAAQNSSLLQFWPIPIGIGIFVTIAMMIFGQKRESEDKSFDYNY